MKPQTVSWTEAGDKLRAGEVGVLPTDTLYGIVGSALKPESVELIYKLRRRELDKPMIILISDWFDLAKLGLVVGTRIQSLLSRLWPGPVSVVVPADNPAFEYLHRGTKSLALRMPDKSALRNLIKNVGPIVAPSANLAGDPPSVSVEMAHSYFGKGIFYVDEGELTNHASAIVDAREEPPKILRTAPGFNLEKM